MRNSHGFWCLGSRLGTNWDLGQQAQHPLPHAHWTTSTPLEDGDRNRWFHGGFMVVSPHFWLGFMKKAIMQPWLVLQPLAINGKTY